MPLGYEHDAFGRAVPTRMAEVFRTRRLMSEWCAFTREASDQIHVLSKRMGGERLNLAQVKAALALAQALVEEGMPYVRCYCEGDKECVLCHGSDWLTGYEFLPESSHAQL